MNMAGLLNKDIISDFKNSFRTNCLILIGEAYKWLKDTKNSQKNGKIWINKVSVWY